MNEKVREINRERNKQREGERDRERQTDRETERKRAISRENYIRASLEQRDILFCRAPLQRPIAGVHYLF